MATNRLRTLAAAGVEPVYKKDSTVQEKAIGNIEKLFEAVTAIQTSDVATTLGKTEVEVLSGRSPIGLYNEQYETLLSASTDELTYVKDACISIASDIFTTGISSEESNKTVEVRSAIDNTDLSVTMKKLHRTLLMMF